MNICFRFRQENYLGTITSIVVLIFVIAPSTCEHSVLLRLIRADIQKFVNNSSDKMIPRGNGSFRFHREPRLHVGLNFFEECSNKSWSPVHVLLAL